MCYLTSSNRKTCDINQFLRTSYDVTAQDEESEETLNVLRILLDSTGIERAEIDKDVMK